jgi:hypothetical protein
VRTSASSTEGESPQPARSLLAITWLGRTRAPWRRERIAWACLASDGVGWGKSGKGD